MVQRQSFISRWFLALAKKLLECGATDAVTGPTSKVGYSKVTILDPLAHTLLVGRQSTTFLPICASLKATVDRAVADVVAPAQESHTPALRRVPIFLQIWYREHGTVGQMAEAIQLSRSRVAHAVQPQTLELVAKRFLDLAWTVEMST